MAEFRIYFKTNKNITVETLKQTGATKIRSLCNYEKDDDLEDNRDIFYVATVNSQKMFDDVAKFCTSGPEAEQKYYLRDCIK